MRLIWMADSKIRTVFLEIKTKTNNYKFVDMPIVEDDTPVEYNGLNCQEF